MKKKFARIAVVAATSVLVLSACATTDNSGDGSTASSSGSASASGSTITIGTTDKVFTLDPAGAYDNGSFQVMIQVYPFLVDSPVGAEPPNPEPNIATSAEFTSPTEYTVKLKEGLTFANGNALTSSDVKFTFDRQMNIADPNGPSTLLGSLESVDAPDDTTVVFNLSNGNDQTFPQILASPVAPIVDEEVFPADALLPDSEIVAAKPFAGQYQIDTYTPNELMALSPFTGYQGELGAVANQNVVVSYYADATNLRLDTENGNVDVAFRSLSATDIASMEGNQDLNVVHGPGGEIRYLVFNFDTMPYGAATDNADPAKALAVRQAVADIVDREAIAADVYKDTYSPLYSYIPDGLMGATETFKASYGDGNGAPDVERATKRLADAGVETPVALPIQYNPDHYGPNSGDEYAAVKSQLEATGLFTVDLQSTEWVQYNKDRVADVYPAYQLGWFPDISDPDNFLSPFFLEGNFLGNHYSNAEVDQVIRAEIIEPDQAAREALLVDAQGLVTSDISTLPLLQGQQIAVTGKNVDGVQFDASFKFRYAPITKAE